MKQHVIMALFAAAGSKPGPMPEGNYKRAWGRCQCGRIGHYDYVPFSLSNPLMYCDVCARDWRHARKITELRAAWGVFVKAMTIRIRGWWHATFQKH